MSDLPAAEEAVGLRVVHSERFGRKAVAVDQRVGDGVRTRDAHRTGFRPQPVGERLAQREHAAADAMLGLQQDRIVAGAEQLRGGDETRHARADDGDSCRARGAWLQTAGEDLQVVGDAGSGDHVWAMGRSRTTSSSACAGITVLLGGLRRQLPSTKTPTSSESCTSFSTSSACRALWSTSSGGTGTR